MNTDLNRTGGPKPADILRDSGGESAPYQQPDTDTQRLKGLRILLAEDYPINRKIALRFLLQWGLLVEVAENGRVALDQYRSGSFDLILMDLEMPLMDGYTAAIEIRKTDPNIPIIALTASGDFSDEGRAAAAGMTDYLTKPFIPRVLFGMIARYCRRS